MVNDKNQFIVKPIYKEALGFLDDLIAVCNDDDLWGYVDKKGMLIIKHQFSKAREFTVYNDGIASVQVGGDTGKWGYINKTGEFLLYPQYDNTWDFKNGIARVQIGENFYLIDKNGNYIFNPENYK
mgnify:FL=1